MCGRKSADIGTGMVTIAGCAVVPNVKSKVRSDGIKTTIDDINPRNAISNLQNAANLIDDAGRKFGRSRSRIQCYWDRKCT